MSYIPDEVVRRMDTPYRVFLFCMVLSASQVLSPYPYLGAICTLSYLTINRLTTVNPWCLLLAVGMAIVGFGGLAVSFDAELAVRVLTACVLLAVLGSLDLAKQTVAIDTIACFLNVTLFLSALGFLYALVGGPHIGSVQNPDGREALVYLTTLSNSVFPAPGGGAVIRPSFIYDEPGAYAFVIDAVLLASFMMHRQLRRQEWALLLGGLLTFSVAHMIVALFLLIAAKKMRYAIIPLMALVAADYYIYITIDYSLVFQRFTVENGTLVGDNRSELFKTGLELLRNHPEGVGQECNWDLMACFNRFGSFGENPAFPGAYYGILPSMSYYFLLICMLVLSAVSLRRDAMMLGLAIVALISQRPFLYSLGYNMLIVMLFSIYVQAFPLVLFRKKICKTRILLKH